MLLLEMGTIESEFRLEAQSQRVLSDTAHLFQKLPNPAPYAQRYSGLRTALFEAIIAMDDAKTMFATLHSESLSIQQMKGKQVRLCRYD